MGAREVATGAAWLDENFPGWERKMDLGVFDIQDCRKCVIGQAVSQAALEILSISVGQYGNVWSALYYLMGDPWVSDHAFAGLHNEPFWVDLIKERFESGNLSDL